MAELRGASERKKEKEGGGMASSGVSWSQVASKTGPPHATATSTRLSSSSMPISSVSYRNVASVDNAAGTEPPRPAHAGARKGNGGSATAASSNDKPTFEMCLQNAHLSVPDERTGNVKCLVCSKAFNSYRCARDRSIPRRCRGDMQSRRSH